MPPQPNLVGMYVNGADEIYLFSCFIEK
jgi:hypothetical protein